MISEPSRVWQPSATRKFWNHHLEPQLSTVDEWTTNFKANSTDTTDIYLGILQGLEFPHGAGLSWDSPRQSENDKNMDEQFTKQVSNEV